MNTCKSCGARITWLETAGGKKVPVDEDPCQDGNIVIVCGMAHVMGKEAIAALPETRHADLPRYKSHFATCPQAKDWRGRGLGQT